MNAQNSRKYLDEEAIRSLPIVNNELELLDIYFKRFYSCTKPSSIVFRPINYKYQFYIVPNSSVKKQ